MSLVERLSFAAISAVLTGFYRLPAFLRLGMFRAARSRRSRGVLVLRSLSDKGCFCAQAPGDLEVTY